MQESLYSQSTRGQVADNAQPTSDNKVASAQPSIFVARVDIHPRKPAIPSKVTVTAKDAQPVELHFCPQVILETEPVIPTAPQAAANSSTRVSTRLNKKHPPPCYSRTSNLVTLALIFVFVLHCF